jgi:hypothetical protein
MFFYLRVTVAVASLVICLLLLPLWFHSYDVAHHIRGSVGLNANFLVTSKQGRFTVLAFRWNGAPALPDWSLTRAPVNDERAFPAGNMIWQTNSFGFATVANPEYPVRLGKVTTILSGGGIVVPYWFVIGLLVAVAAALIKGRFWRFNTYAILISLTFVAVVLGLFVFLDRMSESRGGLKTIRNIRPPTAPAPIALLKSVKPELLPCLELSAVV